MTDRSSKAFLRISIAVVLAGAILGAQAARAATWQKKAAGTYNWSDAANWSGTIPNAEGATADFHVDMGGNQTVNLSRAITIGTLNAGASDGGSSLVIVSGTEGHPLIFQGATPGAATAINFAPGSAPKSMGLNFLSGIRLGGASPLTATINTTAVFECSIRNLDLNGNTFTLIGPRRFNPGSGWSGANWQIGSISGSGNFIQNGSGSNIQGDCPNFTGTLTINNGDFHAVRLPAVSQYVIAGAFIPKNKYPRGGVFRLGGGNEQHSKAVGPARLNPKATLILRGGGHFVCDGQVFDEMAFLGAIRPTVVERVRQVQFHAGLSEFGLENGNHISSSTSLLATDPENALVRQQGATVLVTGDGIRTTQGYWAAMGVAEKLLFTGGMAKHLKGGGGPRGSTNRSIIPWMTIGTIYHPAEGGFATYDDVKGVHPLLEDEEYDDKITGTPDRNVRCDQLNLGTNGTQTVNSLYYTSWGNNDLGAGSVLKITSGALMIGSMGGASIGGTPGKAGTIDFGPAEGVIWPPWVTPYGKDISIGSTIAGSGGLTKTATSTLILTAANTYTGKTCVAAGCLQVGDGKTATSKLGDGDVQVTNGAILRITSQVANAIVDTATVTLDNAGGVFYGTVDLERGVNETVGGLIIDGQTQPAGTYGSSASTAAHKLDNYFTGPGILTVTGKRAAAK